MKDGKNLDSGRVGLGLFGITIPRNGRNKCDQIDSREGFLLGKLGESTGKREQGLVEDCGSAGNGVFLMFLRKKTLNCSFM